MNVQGLLQSESEGQLLILSLNICIMFRGLNLFRQPNYKIATQTKKFS